MGVVYKYKEKLPNNFKKFPEKTYIGIVGGRDVSDYNFVKEKFLNLIKEENISLKNVVIVSGGAKGVDSIAREIGIEMKIPVVEIYPDWQKGKRAGLERNTEIVNLSDIIIAVPSKKSRGTYDTIKKARKKRKRTLVFKI